MENTKQNQIEKIKEILKKEEIKHIYLNFVDYSGNIHTKLVGVKELINNTHVSWFDGISINGNLIKDFEDDEKSDWLVLDPVPYTFRIMPFLKDTQKSAMLMCNIKKYELDARTLLKRASKELQQKGFCAVAGTELIYNIETSQGEQDYYSALATSNSTIFNNELATNLLSAKIDVEYYMPYGKSQNRIDLVPDLVLNSADKLYIAKWFAKNLAQVKGEKINFENTDTNVLACPIHLSIWNKNKENNLFFDETKKYELSDLGRKFINGILYHNKFIKAVALSDENVKTANFETKFSVKRDNSLIQVPLYFNEKQKKDRIGWSKRCIYLGATQSTNYYLILAVLIYAGLYGIENDLEENNLKRTIDNYGKEDLMEELTENKYFQEKLGKDIIRKTIQKLGGIKFEK